MQFHNFIFSLRFLFILFCFLTVNFLRCTIHRKYLISGGIFILFFGCRGFVGWDWYSYYEIYNQTSDLIIQKYSTEPCFGFFMVGCKIIGLDYHGFVLVSTCFDFILLHLIFKLYLSKYYAWGFFFFIVFSMGYEIDLMRNIKALLLFIYSLQYVYRKKITYFLFYNTIAIGFHSSAILFFPLYFLLNRDINKRLIGSLFVIGNLLFICHIGIVKLILLPVLTFMGGVYSMMLINYLDSDLFSQPYGLSFGFVERIVTFFLLYKYASRLEQKSCINRLFINTAYMYLLLMVYCSDFSIFIDRVAAMFRYFYWILIPLLLFGKERISYHKVLISFYLLFSISRTIALTDTILYDYDNILTGMRTFYDRKNTWEHFYINNY